MTPTKWIVIRSIIVACLFAGLISHAQASPPQPCTDAIVHGRYGFLITGTHIGIGIYGLMGTMEADGAGHVHGGGLQSLNGDQREVTFTGTYHVTPECTGITELTFDDKLVGHVRFVIVDDGKEILLMDYGAHTIETGSAKRQFNAPPDPPDNRSVKP